MKTTINISLDKDLKESFSAFAKDLGTNPTNLINMLMKNAVNTRNVNFSGSSYLDLEIERFSSEEMNDLLSSESISKNTKKLKNLLK